MLDENGNIIGATAEVVTAGASPTPVLDPATGLIIKKEPNPVQDRIDQITREKYEAIRRGDQLEAQLAAKKDSEPVVEVELDPDDFDTQSDYLKAVAAKAREDIRKADAKEKMDRDESNRRTVVSSHLSKAREDYPDFDFVALNPAIPITTEMYNASIGANMGFVLYTLGKDPAEAARISRLSPVEQIKEIGKIESKVTQTPVKPVTSAPTPPGTLKGGGGNPPTKLDSEKTREELRAEWKSTQRREAGLEK